MRGVIFWLGVIGVAGDPRRPFPQDIEMRCGVLGQLTAGYKPQTTSKPHPQTTSNGPPPEKKFALAGEK